MSAKAKKYIVLIGKTAAKQIENLPKKVQAAVNNKIETLVENPRPNGCKKLTNSDDYRVRTGDYRIIYNIDDEIVTVHVVKVSKREDAYRK